MTKPLILLIGFMVLSFLAALRLRESAFLNKPAEDQTN
jgi:hypothetical protein